MLPERLAVLVQGYLDDHLPPVESDELAAELARDPRLLDEVLNQISVAAACSKGGNNLHAQLSALLTVSETVDQQRLINSRRFINTRRIKVHRRPSILFRPWLVAAMVAVTTASLLWWMLATSGRFDPVPMLHAHDGDVVVRAGQRLLQRTDSPFRMMPGDALEITHSGARLWWSDGSNLTLESGVQAQIPHTKTVLNIAYGDVACEAPHSDRRFSLGVPGATVTDYGTTFTLAVRPQGTSVAVTSGKVGLLAAQHPEVVITAGFDGYLNAGGVSTAPQAVAAVGFAAGSLFSDDERLSVFSGNGLLWGTTAAVVHQDGASTLNLTPKDGVDVGPWLMKTFYERTLDWSKYRGIRFLVRGSGEFMFQLEDNQQVGGLPQQNERFEAPWQEATDTWRLVTIPFSALTRAQFVPKGVTGSLPNDGLGLNPVRGIGFGLQNAKARIEIQNLALY